MILSHYFLRKKSVTFSNPLFDSNDDFTSSNDESLSDEDVPKDNVKIYSNPLFEFNDEYVSSDANSLFDEVLENIESIGYSEKDKNNGKTTEPSTELDRAPKKTKAKGVPIFYGPTWAHLMGRVSPLRLKAIIMVKSPILHTHVLTPLLLEDSLTSSDMYLVYAGNPKQFDWRRGCGWVDKGLRLNWMDLRAWIERRETLLRF
ncbi:hypothetical protein Tco_0300978 [Tanacetum coccineum]